MRATVVGTPVLNLTDWTVDLTVQLDTDLGVAIKTVTESIDADLYDKAAVIQRLNGLLDREIARAGDFPVTQQQANDIVEDMSIRKPG
jgi:hypothetical protein